MTNTSQVLMAPVISEAKSLPAPMLSGASQQLMTRSVLYTAVTRAKELLILVGDDAVATRMIDNFRQARRYTALRVRLRALCGL